MTNSRPQLFLLHHPHLIESFAGVLCHPKFFNKTIGCLGCKHKFPPLMHLITNLQQPPGSEADALNSISQ